MTHDRPSRGLLWVAAGASLWGVDTILRRPLTGSLSSAQIVLLEHLILSAVLLPVCWRSRRECRGLGARGWAALLGIAWGGSALATVCFTQAVKIGHPTGAVFVQKTQPLFAAVLARRLLGESLDRRFWICLALALLGAYLVSFGDRLDPAAWKPSRAAAAMLALAAAALWGSSTVLGRFLLGRLSFTALTAWRIVVATPFLLGLAWAGPRLPALESAQVRNLALMALVPGLAALLIYYRGLERTRASLAAVAELSFPAVAALLNWIFLDASVSMLQLAGFALLWTVILNLERRPAPERIYAQ